MPNPLNKYVGPNRLSEIFGYIKAELDKKVTVVSGKGLSSNDYTTTEKNKLSGIASGAEVNVQSNWNESSSSSDAYILNKPTKLSDFTNDSGFISYKAVSTVANQGLTETEKSNALLNIGATPYKGNLSTVIGSGSPADATKTYWSSSSNIPLLSVSTAYNNSGSEYTLLFSKGNSNNFGSILKYGYSDTYLRILRVQSGTWKSTDWEKMSAGYADSAGKLDPYFKYYRVCALKATSGSAVESGWYRVCKIGGAANYANYVIHTCGGYNIAEPTNATVLVNTMYSSASMVQLGGQVNSMITRIRLVLVSANTYWLDVYITGKSTAVSGAQDQYLDIYGNVSIAEQQDPTSPYTETVTPKAEITLIDLSGNVITSESISSQSVASATIATKLSNTSKIGDTNKPVYFTANGVPAAISYTIAKSVPSDAVFTDTNDKVYQSASTSTNWRKVLLHYKDDTTADAAVTNSTNQVYACKDISVQPSTGTLQVGSLKIYKETDTIGSNPAQILFSTKNTANNTSYNGSVIRAYHADANGQNMVISPGGNLFIGGGESASSHYSLLKTSVSENIYMTADNITYVQAGGATISNRKGFYVSAYGNIIPCVADTASDNTLNIGSSNYGYANIYTHRAYIYKNLNNIVTGSGTAASDKGSGVSPRYFPAKWTFNLGADATNGDIMNIKIPVAGHSYGVYISVDNGTNYYPVALNGTSRLTTHYGKDTCIQLIFESAGSVASIYPVAGGDATITVTGGCWRVINYYNTNDNTVPSAYCSTAAATAAKTATCTGYALLSKSYLHVIITTANTAASALTLNVNSKGAKPIYINGSASSASNYTLPAGSYLVYYNGTNYYFRTDGKLTADITGNAVNVTGTVAIANGGTGATSRLAAAKNLTNSAVSSPTHIVGLTTDWASFGYTTLANLKTAMNLNNVDNTSDANKSVASATTATTASKLSNTSKIGDTNKPVYFTANGVPAAISYTIASNVPSGAVFTDTKVTQTAVAASSYTNWRPLVIGYSNSSTEDFSPTTETNGVYTTNLLSCQPSTGTIRSNRYSGKSIYLGTSNTTDGTIRIYNSSHGYYADISSNSTQTGSIIITLPKTGGTLALSGSSSRRVKKNISDMTIEEANKLFKLRPVNYDYIDKSKGENCYGFIAEEVEDIGITDPIIDTTFPGIEGNVLGLDYAKFVPYLVKVVQMQQKEIEELRERTIR